jgi:hypothetical protein
MASSITLPADINVSTVTYGTPKNLDNGGKIIPVYHNSKPFIIQIPNLSAPYGLKKWDNEKGGFKVHLDVSFGNYKEEGINKLFFDKISELDDKFISDALDNSMTWLKKKYNTKDVLQALYTPMVKFSKDSETGDINDKYPPTMKLQVPFRDNKYSCEVYDKKCQLIKLEEVETKGAQVSAIIQCSGVWVAGGKFGVKWRVVQMKVSPRNSRITGYAFIEEDSDNEDEQ